MVEKRWAPARLFSFKRLSLPKIFNLTITQKTSNMILTTTPAIEGKQIVNYHGVVFGEVITGINFVKDFFAGVRNIVGGRSESYEEELMTARDTAMRELEQRAFEKGANAVVGIDLDYEVLGQNNGMLMVIASGTAVTVA